MKFGKYIDEQARPDWRDKYLDYSQLKHHIKDAAARLESGSDGAAFSPRTTSLSVSRKPNDNPEEEFFNKLEDEVCQATLLLASSILLPAVSYGVSTCCGLQLKKISGFTETLVKQLRSQTKALHAQVSNAKAGQQHDELMQVK